MNKGEHENPLFSLLKAWARDIFVAVLGSFHDIRGEQKGVGGALAGVESPRSAGRFVSAKQKKSRSGGAVRP